MLHKNMQAYPPKFHYVLYTCMSAGLSSHLVSLVVAADIAFVAHEQCSVYVVTFRVGGMSISQSLLWLYSLYTITIYSRMVGGT